MEKVGARTHSLANKKKCCNSGGCGYGVYAVGHAAECVAADANGESEFCIILISDRDGIVISQRQAQMIRWIAGLLWFLKVVVMEWNYLTRDIIETTDPK